MCAQSLGHVQLLLTPWTITHQAPLSMEFSRQEYLSWLSFPTPGDLPDPGIEPVSPAFSVWQADSLPLCHLGSPEAKLKQPQFWIYFEKLHMPPPWDFRYYLLGIIFLS